MATLPESKLQLIFVDNHYELANKNRRFVNYVCKELHITRKRFKKLMKRPEFKLEFERQLDKLHK